MKMNLDMSFEEGMKVVNALRECATKYGWVVDECSIMEEYTAAVDAALTAMGISVSIAPEPEVEEEAEDEDENKYCDSAADCCFCNSDDEEWHEDAEDGYFNADDDEEDDDSTVYSLTAKGEFVLRYMNAGHTFKEACKIADILFGDGE